MRTTIYGHRFGDKVIKKDILDSIKTIIESINHPLDGNHKSIIKSDILAGFHQLGWSEAVQLAPGSHITITSVKDQVGLCFQSGNMGRMYADILKLQALYERETIYAGIMVLFTQPAAAGLGSNMANFDRLVRELPIFERVITSPIAVIGIEN